MLASAMPAYCSLLTSGNLCIYLLAKVIPQSTSPTNKAALTIFWNCEVERWFVAQAGNDAFPETEYIQETFCQNEASPGLIS